MKLRLSRTDSSNVPGNHSSINSPNLLAKSLVRPNTGYQKTSDQQPLVSTIKPAATKFLDTEKLE
ncbi:hypothetical protein FGRA07_09015 [Fusarium graminearum]|nr:hypothetical protein FGRA07_09015 [Fusarium graminearum]